MKRTSVLLGIFGVLLASAAGAQTWPSKPVRIVAPFPPGGVADVLIDTPNGQIQVAEMKKNDFLGEIAILCDVPRTATIKAREPLNTLKISKDTFYRMVGEFPQMAIEIMRELAHRVEDTNKKLREATANKAA